MKKFSLILVMFFILALFSGCTHEMVSLYIYKMPDKLVYNINEELDISGLQLKNIKTDSALLSINNKNVNFSGFDSSTSGIKEVVISYGKWTTSFNIYVANKVASNNDELVAQISNLEDDDILLIKKGSYELKSPIEINNSNIVIGGEGMDKTIINSFCIIGGYQSSGEIIYNNLANNVVIVGVGFENESIINDSVVKFVNDNYNYKLGCINSQKSQGLKIIACNFKGFSYGVKCEELENALITASKFDELFVGGIEVTKSAQNTTISKNIIQNIGNSVVNLNENNNQDNLFGIKLAFNKEVNCGVSLYKNSISKIGLRNEELKFLNEKVKGDFNNLNYMYHSAGIILHSSDKNNLQTNGISIFFNSIGTTLNNILYNTNENDSVNSNSVLYMAM